MPIRHPTALRNQGLSSLSLADFLWNDTMHRVALVRYTHSAWHYQEVNMVIHVTSPGWPSQLRERPSQIDQLEAKLCGEQLGSHKTLRYIGREMRRVLMDVSAVFVVVKTNWWENRGGRGHGDHTSPPPSQPRTCYSEVQCVVVTHLGPRAGPFAFKFSLAVFDLWSKIVRL